jgi:uncharacterized membrane protein
MSGPGLSSGSHLEHGSTESAAMADWVRAHAWVLTVWGAMLAWSMALFQVVRGYYETFRLARYDLGNMVQAVWSTAHGSPLDVTNGLTGEQMVRLGFHVDPILVLLAPLWLIAPTPLLLVATQVLAVALGALPLFWLARRHLESEQAAGLLALGYLAYPWIAWTAVDVFHPVTLAIPLLLFAMWFLDSDRLLPFALCAILVAATGELMALGVAGLGLWYALARGRRRFGLSVFAGAISWALVALYVIVPAFSGGSSPYFGAYDEVGGSPAGILGNAVTSPWVLLDAVGRSSDLLYLALLTVPLGGLFVLAPGMAALALPQLSANLLAGFDSATDPHAHYVAGVLPFLFAATALGLSRLAAAGRVRGAVLVLTLSLAVTIVAGPWPGALGGTPTWFQTDTSRERLDALRDAVALVPDEAAVGFTNRVGSHLSARRYAYSAPHIDRAEWVVMDVSDTWVPHEYRGRFDPDVVGDLHQQLERSARWRKVFDRQGVLVFRRVKG